LTRKTGLGQVKGLLLSENIVKELMDIDLEQFSPC